MAIGLLLEEEFQSGGTTAKRRTSYIFSTPRQWLLLCSDESRIKVPISDLFFWDSELEEVFELNGQVTERVIPSDFP